MGAMCVCVCEGKNAFSHFANENATDETLKRSPRRSLAFGLVRALKN